jgi:hypothetical protein
MTTALPVRALPAGPFYRRLTQQKIRRIFRMDVVPLGPGFVAELRGVTLADVASDDAAYAAARAAFEQHSVLVFRGQEVTDEFNSPFRAASARRK